MFTLIESCYLFNIFNLHSSHEVIQMIASYIFQTIFSYKVGMAMAYSVPKSEFHGQLEDIALKFIITRIVAASACLSTWNFDYRHLFCQIEANS